MHIVKELTFHNSDSVSVTLESAGSSTGIHPEPGHLKSIMQFTGLFDKNGKEIYESDRVKLYRKGSFVTAVVIFENGLFCLQYEDGYKNIYPLNPENYEVTGHIFEG
jgi:uncharacterized phage protein (TIGR01671 family)